MAIYSARVRTNATSSSADHAVATLWNPHSSKRITVFEIGLCCTSAPASGATIYLRRATTRGSPAATVTPAIQHELKRMSSPESGALIDIAAYTTQPTFETGGFMGWSLAPVAASGFIYPLPRGIEIPAGSGLSIVTASAVAIPASEVWFVWEE